jgi:hypothetical protein
MKKVKICTSSQIEDIERKVEAFINDKNFDVDCVSFSTGCVMASMGTKILVAYSAMIIYEKITLSPASE